MALDTLYSVDTPEGIQLRLSPAGPVPRMLAWIIDVVIRLGINLILYISLAILGETGMGIALILTFLLEWFYPVYFELFHQGQTPGKKSFNLYVTMENASPVSAGASIIRNVLRFVDFLPFFYGFGLISMLLTRRFQRLGDLVAGTVVLHKPLESPALKTIAAAPLAPPLALQLAEQQALLRFYQRYPGLTRERSRELALASGRLVRNGHSGTTVNQTDQGDINKPQDADSPEQKLLGMASWIMGKTS